MLASDVADKHEPNSSRPVRAILVTDGEQRAALAVVRSLGAAGFAPFVCSHSSESLAGASRFARGSAVVPNPLTDPAGFAGGVRDLVERWRIDVVQPVSEQSHIALLSAPELFRGVVVPAPDLATFRRICDKEEVLAAAREIGLAVPRQATLASPEVADTADLPPYPLVIKPSRSIQGGARHGVSYAGDEHELRELLAKMPRSAFPVLVQQRIIGPGTGVFLLRWNGRLVAKFAHRRVREFPPSGGGSVVSESLAAAPELVERSLRLLEAFDWNGVAMIEFKTEARTQIPYLMEINGRFWGSLQLAIDAGVDFPSLLVRAALGEEVTTHDRYRVGVRLRSWWGDVNHLLARMRHSRTRLALPVDAPSRARVLYDFIVPRRVQRHEVLRSNDLQPFLVESRDWWRSRRNR